MENTKFDIYECIKLFPKEDLKKLHHRERDGRMKMRLLALYHLKLGRTLKDVIEITLCDESAIRRWVKKYSTSGFNGLQEEIGRGRYPKWPGDKESAATEEIKKMQELRQGGRVTGGEIQKMLRDKFNVDYKLRSVYVLLDRLGFSWISCRSKHPKRSQEAIEAFKNDFPDIVDEVKQNNPSLKLEVWWQDEMRIGQQGSLTDVTQI